MKMIFSVFVAAALCFGQTKKPSESEALKQIERDWTDAQKNRDADKLNQIIADDWIGVGYDGNKTNKQDFINDVKSGASKLESFTFADMDVKILGNIAIVQGGDTEKSSTHGDDTSGKWVWTDVFVKRDGRWQAVRSQSAKVK
jgi:ketosteroid isomerase-like protein